jgi:hypothetical protein
MTMVNNVIEVLNYVIAARPLPLNSVIADSLLTLRLPRCRSFAQKDQRDATVSLCLQNTPKAVGYRR